MTTNIVPTSNLDPELFEFPQASTPKLQIYARTQILSGLARVQSIVNTDFCIIYGPALASPDKKATINVLIGIDEDRVNRINTMSLNILLKDLNNQVAGSTQHPLAFFLTTDEYSVKNLEQAYAPIDDKWLKYVLNERNDGAGKRNTAIRHAWERDDITSMSNNRGSIKPDLYKANMDDMTVGKKPFIAAHNADSGIWNITSGQAIDILNHFNAQVPTSDSPYKMLGNTGIMLHRPDKHTFRLLKGEILQNKVTR